MKTLFNNWGKRIKNNKLEEKNYNNKNNIHIGQNSMLRREKDKKKKEKDTNNSKRDLKKRKKEKDCFNKMKKFKKKKYKFKKNFKLSMK